MREDQGLATAAHFVVDPGRMVQIMEITSEGVGRNATELVRKIKALNTFALTPTKSAQRHGKKERILLLHL